MKKLILAILILLVGCDTKQIDNTLSISLSREYVDSKGNGDYMCFVHYLSLSGCGSPYCDFNSVLKMVKYYYDTCQTKRPIGSICIIRHNKEHDFQSNEPDFVQVYKDALIEIYFEKEGVSTASFPIEKIAFFEKGEVREIDIAILDSLMK